jgi:hypothetical protein
MLYLLDANVLITAQNSYYPIDQVPEFWEWLCYQGTQDKVKIPLEIMEEMRAGSKQGDSLLDWIKNPSIKSALLLKNEPIATLVQRVVYEGYAPDLTDIDIEQLGCDPFLIAYALSDSDRCIVTTEVSKPSKKRQNRKVPDVCQTFSIPWLDPFKFNRSLGFRTAWKKG